MWCIGIPFPLTAFRSGANNVGDNKLFEVGELYNNQEASSLLEMAAHKCTFASNVDNKSEMIYVLSHLSATFNIFERH